MIPFDTVSWCILCLFLGALLSALIIAVEHWFPWSHELTLIQKYVAGSLAIWLGFTLWQALAGNVWSAVGLLVIYAFGGATVWVAYYIDHNKTNGDKIQAIEENDEEL